MENELDFSSLSLQDVSVNGQSLAEQAAVESTTAENTTSGTETAPAAESIPEQVKNVDSADSYNGPVIDTGKIVLGNNLSLKDDFIKGAVEYYEKTGDLSPYLQAKLVDFNGMSDEEIMRRSLREQYPDVSDKAFDRLFKQQIVDKYKIDADEWGEEDAELGRELLKTEASKPRQKYIEWQNGFKAPEPVQSQEAQQQQAEVEEALRQFEQSVKSSPLTNQIMNDKRIAIKIGDNEFNYELPDANSMVDMTLDNDKFFQQFAAGEGQLDYSKWYKTVAYSQNPELFEKALINYGKTLGREEVTKEIKNPSTNIVGDVPTESSSDFATGLLQAFAARGVNK
jgi:hypothetical protein